MITYNCYFNYLIALSYSSDDDADDDDDGDDTEEVDDDDEDDDDTEEVDEDDDDEEEEEEEDDDFTMKMTEEVNFVGRQVYVWRFKIIVECVFNTA
jgi:hypothetical protein